MEKELGRIKLNDSTDVVVRRTEYKGEDRVDIRKWVSTEQYEGWTKQGISLAKDVFDELLSILKGIDETWDEG